MNKSKGFSLIELLAAILILSLVSGGLVTGVMLSNKQYKSSIRQSEASELYNTISSLLNYELKLTKVKHSINRVNHKNIQIIVQIIRNIDNCVDKPLIFCG